MQWLRDSNEGLASAWSDPKPFSDSTGEQLQAIDSRTQRPHRSRRAPQRRIETPRPTSFLGEAARKYVSGRALLPHAANS